jgi:hypothetical protein
MPTLGAPLDFAKLEGRNFQAHQLGAAPASPVKGQLYYNTGDNTLYWYDGTAWQSAKGGSGSPTGAAGGDLSGTYPNPQIATGVIVDTDVAAANKDGAVATPSLRTLGSGATQAAPGNDARFTDARAPTAHKTTHEPGGSDPLTVDAVVATGSLRTLGAGAQQAMPGNRTLDAITIPVADMNFNTKRLTAVAAPTANNDAANKAYVDNAIQGLDAKQSVKVKTPVAVNVNIASAPTTIDAIPMNVGDRVLLNDQTAPSENGIYVYNGSGVAMTRSSDMDAGTEFPEAYTWVESGSSVNTGWVCTNASVTLGSTAITFVQFSGAGQITAGAGLTKSSNTLDVGAGTGISVAADTVGIANGGVNTAQMAAGAVNLNTGAGLVSGILAIPNGGTGNATTKSARENGLVASGYYSSATHGAGTTITILQSTHGLRSTPGLVVQCQKVSDGSVIIPDVVVAANGDVTVTFAASQSANSIQVTVTG